MNIQPYPNSLAVPAVNIRLFSELFFHNTRHGKARSERFTAAPGRACAFGAKLRACPHRRTYSSRPPRQYKKGTQHWLCSLFGCPWQTRKERSDGIAHRSPLYKEAARSRHCRRAKRSTKSVRCEAHEKREVPCLGTSLFWLPLADSNCRHCG